MLFYLFGSKKSFPNAIMIKTVRNVWSNHRNTLVQTISITIAAAVAIVVNTHVIRSDGPGPIGHAVAIYIVIAINKKRFGRKPDM